jgi:hypothetical protein
VRGDPNRNTARERQRIAGGRVIEQVMALERIPLYGREGALAPLGPAVQHTGELGPDVAISELLVFGLPLRELVPRGLGFQVGTGEGLHIHAELQEHAQLAPHLAVLDHLGVGEPEDMHLGHLDIS